MDRLRDPDDHDQLDHHDHNRQEHAINVCIYLYDGSSIGVIDHRSPGDYGPQNILDLDDPTNDGTIVDVLRAVHDRCPRQYHANIIDAALYEIGYIPCAWCPDDVTGRERPARDGQQ